jgi:hypothetical protein
MRAVQKICSSLIQYECLDLIRFIRLKTSVVPAADSTKMSMLAAQAVAIKWAKTQVG